MFTGIVQEIGKIKHCKQQNRKKYFQIECLTMQTDLSIGDSIACNGVCLSVLAFTENDITCETMQQTLLTTTAGFWKVGTPIHLERAMKLSDRINGHLVQGHIDTVTNLTNVRKDINTPYYTFFLPQQFSQLIVDHGSICIDGVSLTIAEATVNSFTVALIEQTLTTTFFQDLTVNSKVNLEFDVIGKYVSKLLSSKQLPEQNISIDWAIKNGFK